MTEERPRNGGGRHSRQESRTTVDVTWIELKMRSGLVARGSSRVRDGKRRTELMLQLTGVEMAGVHRVWRSRK
jgi:hypothetical protein